MFVSLEKIEGFKSNSETIEVFDSSGKPFYFFSNPEKKEITFNILKGEYYFGCDVKILSKPLIFEPKKLPRPEKNKYVHENIDFIVKPNPNKASIDISNALIIIDEKYFNENEIPFVNFMMFHELGHYKYKTEWKCDLFSAYNMLKLGFNPTQCYYANSICLSDRQNDRKEILFNYLKQTKVL